MTWGKYFVTTGLSNVTGAAPGINTGTITKVAFPMLPLRSVLLLELFETGMGARSTGIYWAGKSNQIICNHDGVPVTYDIYKARQIPLEFRDIAEALAQALNDSSERTPETLMRVWRAVEHGFS